MERQVELIQNRAACSVRYGDQLYLVKSKGKRAAGF